MKFLKKLWAKLKRPNTRTPLWMVLGVGGLMGVAVIGSVGAFFAQTNTLEFCISCHEMRGTIYEDYLDSVHYKNSSGVRAECPDCHVPKEFFPMLKAKIIAVKDVWHTMLGTVDTPEKFEARAYYMAERVWEQMRANDSAPCRSCHNFDFMDLSEQGRLARRKHERSIDNGETCIDCHQGITHYIPDEPEEPEEEISS